MNRANSKAMDNLLGQEYKILNSGFIRVVDYMGNDEAIVQAARVSYGTGTKTRQEDSGLIRYLMRHHHSTPFEMLEIKLHVKLPLFVARQWIRHRTANVNEYSARYSILDREFYIPEADDIRTQSLTNKQGRSENFEIEKAIDFQQVISDSSEDSYTIYENLLANDVSRETARMVLPTNIYTQWYWKVDLHNLFHFLRLRADPHAQMEIRVYAEKICEIVKLWVPEAYAAFDEYVLGSKNLSRSGLKGIAMLISGESPTQTDLNMSIGEWNEFRKFIKDL